MSCTRPGRVVSEEPKPPGAVASMANTPGERAPDLEALGGRIVVLPRLKYELGLSLHVLRYAEDHHAIFVEWATQLRSSLSDKTLADATLLIASSHEWQLGYLLQAYDGPDDIQRITEHLRGDSQGIVTQWAVKDGSGRNLASAAGVTPNQLPNWYADFLRRYWDEGFGKTWDHDHWPLIETDARRIRDELDAGPNRVEQLEKVCNKKFFQPGRIRIYPSSFSRPKHGYGFEEGGEKVVLVRVGDDVEKLTGTIFHELLHSLIRGWTEREDLRPLIDDLAQSEAFRQGWEQVGRGSYQYPEGWLDELYVHAIARYALYKVGLLAKSDVPLTSYTGYEDTLYPIIFDHFDQAGSIDAFLGLALRSIDSAKATPN